MRFWDSSALIPLILEQPYSPRSRALLEDDPDGVIWWGTPIECASAFARLRREGRLTPDEEVEASHLVESLRSAWHEVQPGDGLRVQALRVLRLHQLRAGDALQLAAAIEWGGGPPSGEFLTFDERLGMAAKLEGFTVLS